MTAKQVINYNKMLKALQTISKGYSTPAQLRRESERDYGLEFEEAIELAYENIQSLAKQASKGVQQIKIAQK